MMSEINQGRQYGDVQMEGIRVPRKDLRGFTIVELLIVVLVSGILAAMAIPRFQSAMQGMQLNSTVSAISGAISQARYAAIANAQVYTLAITAPANTYVVSNVTAGTSNAAVPLPSTAILINNGTAATYTYTLCPNGTVYGAGGTCPTSPLTAPPALAATNNGRQVNINVSSVGNVATTRVQ
ncbi:MAG TPA: prepilin-type N-terminal cleavage/methylation domain-containing protein [Terriglobales bacterium]|nr:prepilin-type N-terminal cleavage/methylation domain-containing protein [Terriglobales bacterium]